MIRLTRILVATDFSPAADAALAHGRRLAEEFGASLHLVHAFEDPYTTAAFAAEVHTFSPLTFRDALLAQTQKQLADRLPPPRDGSVAGTTQVVAGPPAQAIVEEAAAIGADLVVIGTHGRSGMAHLLIGSVAERVLRTAPCPVLTVHDAPPRAVKRILVPTDFSATADAALEYAYTLAERLGATVQLLHVLDDPLMNAGGVTEACLDETPLMRGALLRDARSRIAHRSVHEGMVRVEGDVLFGHGASTIAEYAAERGIDVIVMGTHGRTGLAHLLIGSVAERLVRVAPCPVLTVRYVPQLVEREELVYGVEYLPA